MSTPDLLKMKHSRGVDLEILFRNGPREEDKKAALEDLAAASKTTPAKALLDAVKARDAGGSAEEESVIIELLRLLTSRPEAELAAIRIELEMLAFGGSRPIDRAFGIAALAAADGSVEKVWLMAIKTTKALQDLLNATPLIQDPNLRSALYPKIKPLLEGLPVRLGGKNATSQGLAGRFVRIELPGRSRTLTLAEVQVKSGGKNIAPQGKASQKNVGYGGEPGRAIDGNTSGSYDEGGQTHTQEGVPSPWWELDFGDAVPIDSIVVYNRTDGGFGKRLQGFTLEVLDSSRNPVFVKRGIPAPEPVAIYEIGSENPEAAVRRAAMNALTYVRGHEEETFRALAKFADSGTDRSAAVAAMQRIPQANRPAELAQPLVKSLVAYVSGIPSSLRTSPEALGALELADQMASLMKPADASTARKELGALGVRVIRIGTVLEQMRYDVERTAAQTGRPVEIIFENNDLMPHNVVVTAPGSLEEVGLLAEATANQADALSRQYVPNSPKILLSSKLVSPRETVRIRFSAPNEPGVYPFVCTYPGHWRRMYGAFYIVADLDQYLADPEGYLASHPLPIKDELLKFNRPRKEWKLEDLASSASPLEPGRSFKNGKQLFEVASCVSCHKLNGVGQSFGPDLSKLDAKKHAIDVLKSVLEPSAEIEDKYASYSFETDSGQVVTGMILEETPDVVKVIENPLVKADAKVLKKSEILGRKKSPTSIMPKGLLDKLTRDEILDLVSYVAARGDAKDPLFKGQGHEHGAAH